MIKGTVITEQCTFCYQHVRKQNTMRVCCDDDDFVCFSCIIRNSNFNSRYVCQGCHQPLGLQYPKIVASLKKIIDQMKYSDSSNDSQKEKDYQDANIRNFNLQFHKNLKISGNQSQMMQNSKINGDQSPRFGNVLSFGAKSQHNQEYNQLQESQSVSPNSNMKTAQRAKSSNKIK